MTLQEQICTSIEVGLRFTFILKRICALIYGRYHSVDVNDKLYLQQVTWSLQLLYLLNYVMHSESKKKERGIN